MVRVRSGVSRVMARVGSVGLGLGLGSWVSRVSIKVRVIVRLMVWVRGKGPGGECPGGISGTLGSCLSLLMIIFMMTTS